MYCIKCGTVWAWAVKMCTDVLEMGCRFGLQSINGLYLCGTWWTCAVKIEYCQDMHCKDCVQTGHGLQRWGTIWKSVVIVCFIISIAHVHIVLKFTAHVQSRTHVYSIHSDCTPSLQPISSVHPSSTTRQYPNVFTPCPALSIFYSPCSETMLSIKFKSRQNAIFVALLLPMSRQYTISTAHTQSEYHFSCLCPVSTPSLLSMSNQYMIFSAHHQ